ncbi:cupin domain-containing protein [Pseudonocardia sp. RS010]|uniref:cupin domain-containing protein n=1 Tax=Pseudonocardia sp. RS010 TaxID=3385979 RepID=UPI0039A3CEB0
MMDVEQVWTVVDGGMTLRTAGGEAVLAAGDTTVLPAGAPRTILADPRRGCPRWSPGRVRVMPCSPTGPTGVCRTGSGDAAGAPGTPRPRRARAAVTPGPTRVRLTA